jgi:DNA-binding MarR family transcriptional regulator
MSPAKKSPVDRITAQCLVARVRLLNRKMTRIYDDALRPAGLKANQMGMLVVVAKHGPCTPGDVGAGLDMEKSTVSRNLEVLRRQGWIEALPGSDDRSHRVRITAKGRRLLEKALPRWEEAQKKAHSLLGKDGVSALLQMVHLGP